MLKIIDIKKILLLALVVFSFLSCDYYPDGIPNLEHVTIKLSNFYPRKGENISVQLVGNSSDFVSVAWDFGDGTTADKSVTTKKYSKEGAYKIQVRFQTKKSGTVSKFIMVKVTGESLSNAIADLKKNTSKIWVLAHRGITQDFSIPENSLKALEACISAGIDVMELDTHITKDGIVVVCHDETINRTTTGTGKISDLTFDEIRKFNLLDRKGNKTNEVMPSLAEMLEAGRGRIFFNLDYSPRTASTKDVFTVVNDCGMIEGVFFYTGSKGAYVKELLSYSSDCHPYPWGGRLSNYEALLKLARDFFIQLDFTNVNSDAHAECLRNGMLISFNVLNADFETQFLSGDYSKVDGLIAGKARMIQTDLGKAMINYLKDKGHR